MILTQNYTPARLGIFPILSSLEVWKTRSKLVKPSEYLESRAFFKFGIPNLIPKLPNLAAMPSLPWVLPEISLGGKHSLPTGESSPWDGGALSSRGEGCRTLLALDLGTTTGWALSNKHGRIMSGTAHFRPRRFEGGGMRYLRFERWLNETRDVSGEINAVYFEEVRRHLGVDAAHAYGGFLGHLSAWCEHHKIPYQGVPVGAIKKHVTGKGNAGKQAVIDAVRALGFDPIDDNEADALALLQWVLSQHGGAHG